MKRFLTLIVVLLALPVRADMIAPPPVSQRAATAAAVVVGKAAKFTDKMIPSEMYKGDMRQMQVAIVKVSESLTGGKFKEIKVGFFPPRGGPLGSRRPSPNLEIGMETLMLLQKHPTQKDVYVLSDYFSVIRKKDNPNFAAELAGVKKAAKLLADPIKGLKSKDAEERYLATMLLISRYRTAPTPDAKTEHVSATESKLILTNLSEADWGRSGRGAYQTTPLQMFFRLNLTAKDGWTIKPGANIQEQAKAWLKANAGKYKIVRFVRPKTETTTDPEP